MKRLAQSVRSAPALLAIGALALACRQAAPPEPVRVESSNLDLAIAALPEPFEVTSDSGDTIELVAPGENGEGHLTIRLGEAQSFGVNLVEAVKERKVEFEAAAGGRYLGNRELGTPTGTAFTARGTYEGANGPVEETWIYMLHPSQRNRMLTLTYRYPPSESEARVGQLLTLLGEIEVLATANPETPA